MKLQDLTEEQREWIDNRFDPHYLPDRKNRSQFLRTSQVNTEALLREYRWMKREDKRKQNGKPSHWDQTDWIQDIDLEGGRCGTACCLAGHTALQEHSKKTVKEWSNNVSDDGDRWTIEVEAAKMLGLNTVQADVLFEEYNDINDMRIGLSILTGKELK